jgi:hypothetical protein
VLKGALDSTADKSTAPVPLALAAARQDLVAGDFDRAQQRLELLRSQGATPEELQQVAAVEQEIAQRRAELASSLEHQAGTNFFDALLVRYEERWLQGQPDPPKVRLFLLRCREFKRRWPEHPEIAWVERQETRFRGSVDLDAPPTWADVDWEVQALVGTSPRNYRRAFELVGQFLDGAAGEDRKSAEELRARMVVEREAYHEDRKQQAKFEYEREDVGKSVWWLVHSVIWLGEPAMEDEAAAILVKIETCDDHLRAYKQSMPEKFDALMKNAIVRDYALQKGLL